MTTTTAQTLDVTDMQGTHWRNRHTGIHIEVLGVHSAEGSAAPIIAYVRSSSGRHFWMALSLLYRNYSRVIND